ncbi:MAG: gliding motility-associated C-terminal domain-containing protein [Flavobacteriales bacterium]|nr:gliding motility-associated C-terminal domain-containing protein [Flavobacteriales bacterium]MCB9194025.1 gliding motility-associated C-terminal domain-containing protein [Flavobacteriales bacterium]
MRAKDELNQLLQQRFAGHEMPVDASVWQAITAQVAAPVAGADEALRGSLKQRFAGHEMPVDPSVWSAVSSQAGIGGGAAGGIGMGWVAAGVTALTLTAGAWYLTRGTASEVPPATAEVRVGPATNVTPDPIPEQVQVTPVDNGPKQEDAPATQQERSVPTRPVTNEIATQRADQVSDQRNAATTADPDNEDVQTHQASPFHATTDADRSLANEQRTNANASQLDQAPTPARTAEEGPDGASTATDIGTVMGGEQENTQEVPSDANAASAPTTEPPVEEVPKAEFHLFLPNVFTPNGDGTNDQYEISCVGCEQVAVMITDSYTGKLVFTAQDLHPWDANDMSGTPCPVGQYTVFVQAVDMNGQRHREKLYLQLMR